METEVKCQVCKSVVLKTTDAGYLVDEFYCQTELNLEPFMVICEPCARAEAERAWEARQEYLNR